jgi:AGZA family xanthine/uracil permease-like MFS transporter
MARTFLNLPLGLKRSDYVREAVAGATTFFTMAYIVVVNPSILSTPGTGLEFSGVLTATVLLCFSMTLLMGVYAGLPYGVAPGMGINAFFTFGIILGQGVPWQKALGIFFWAGVLFLLVSVTPLRVSIARAIPSNLRMAAAGGIGIFLTFIGLKNAQIVTSDPVTFVKLNQLGLESGLALVGIFLTVFLMRRKNPFAFLGGIFAVTVVAAILGRISAPQSWFSMPDFNSVFFKLDAWGALQLAFVPAMISILFTDLFDSISTFVGVAHASGLTEKDGQPKNLKEGLIVDSFATLGAGLLGTSSGTAYIESSAGIEAGGRTGWTSVFTAFLFLPCLFIAPVAALVPAYATAPVLIIVGALMFRSLTDLKVATMEETLPAFLTVVLIPLTFSITQGILWGFISHGILFFLAGRAKEVSPMMRVLAVLSAVLMVVEHTTLLR